MILNTSLVRLIEQASIAHLNLTDKTNNFYVFISKNFKFKFDPEFVKFTHLQVPLHDHP